MDEELASLLRKIYRFHKNRLQEYLNAYDLYVGQPPLLFCIQRHGKMSQKDIIRQTHMSKEVVSISIKRLEAMGFIVKDIDPKDHRRTLISLTALGEAMIEKCRKNYGDASAQTFAPLDSAEKQTLALILNKLVGAQEENHVL